MSTRVKLNLGIKLLLFVCLFLFTGALCSFAKENSLLGIDVRQNDNGYYNIQLKLDNFVQIHKINNDNDNISLLIDSTIPSNDVEIVYDNASDLNNVIVQKKNDGNTLILFQGKNIQNSLIYAKELSTGLIKQADVKNNSAFVFIAHKKILIAGLFSFFMIFLVRLFSRPKKKTYTADNVTKQVKQKNKAMTLRKKNLVQSKRIPSISGNTNGSFNNNSFVSKPKDFVINNYNLPNEDKIRKVG